VHALPFVFLLEEGEEGLSILKRLLMGCGTTILRASHKEKVDHDAHLILLTCKHLFSEILFDRNYIYSR
jgi:hypothetical protein